jgi:FkbH-like protein
MLPEVAVPDFPDQPESLAPAMSRIYEEYFAKPVLTGEDLDKTAQYAANAKRAELEKQVNSFDDYLKQLQIVITREDPESHADRLLQLVNKTNQFNLTTKRYSQQEMQEMLQDPGYRFFLYRVEDKFGDNGLVVLVIIKLPENNDHAGIPKVETFVMSCRVMGKQIENAVLQDVEKELLKAGYRQLEGMFIPTAKNMPVEKLYPNLGYETRDISENGTVVYRADLEHLPKREYRATMQIKE